MHRAYHHSQQASVTRLAFVTNDLVPSWAIACIVSVVALAVSTGFYAVYRIRTRKHRKDSLSAEYVVEE